VRLANREGEHGATEPKEGSIRGDLQGVGGLTLICGDSKGKSVVGGVGYAETSQQLLNGFGV